MMRTLALVGVVALAGGIAAGDVIVTFGYTDLYGAYSTGTGIFTADAADVGSTRTSGDVTRIGMPGDTADFDAGFVSRSSFADVGLSMSITGVTSNSATGSGQLILTDDDGDTIACDVHGQFANGGFGIYFFTGYLTNVTLSGTTFDGTDGGSFDMDLPGNEPYEGALIQLFIHGASHFFTNNFAGVSVQLSGEIIPAPAGVLALAVLGPVGSRRRR
ncbi:MAG: hypothetical protein KJZ65_13695 [Phycisphaerales bacterium]|nr:hypothetical protein [Phycisphaerales bacterium]